MMYYRQEEDKWRKDVSIVKTEKLFPILLAEYTSHPCYWFMVGVRACYQPIGFACFVIILIMVQITVDANQLAQLVTINFDVTLCQQNSPNFCMVPHESNTVSVSFVFR